MEDQRILMTEKQIETIIQKIAREFWAKRYKNENSGIIGIKTRGIHVAKRIQQVIKNEFEIDLPMGEIDISLYRDDFALSGSNLSIGPTNIPFNINGKSILLVDDVLYTGRTIRAALDEIIDFGRPAKVELAVLIDRGLREFPIQPDYCGAIITTTKDEYVYAKLSELDGEDKVLVSAKQ